MVGAAVLALVIIGALGDGSNDAPSTGAAIRMNAGSLRPKPSIPRSLPLVRREGRQHFILLTRRDPEVIERASQLSRDLIELLGGDVEVAMGLFQPEGGASWPSWQ